MAPILFYTHLKLQSALQYHTAPNYANRLTWDSDYLVRSKFKNGKRNDNGTISNPQKYSSYCHQACLNAWYKPPHINRKFFLQEAKGITKLYLLKRAITVVSNENTTTNIPFEPNWLFQYSAAVQQKWVYLEHPT